MQDIKQPTPTPAKPKHELKLSGITFDRVARIPGIRAGDLTTLRLDDYNNGPLLGWRVIVRKGAIVFVSPPGWTSATATEPTRRNLLGPCEIHEVPRADVFLHWTGDEEAIAQVANGGVVYESKPLGWKPAPVESDKPILAQIPVAQIGDA